MSNATHVHTFKVFIPHYLITEKGISMVSPIAKGKIDSVKLSSEFLSIFHISFFILVKIDLIVSSCDQTK